MRILIVEDEKEIADGTKAVLEKEGYSVDAVYDGLYGMEYVLSDVYDLILLDVMLPKINGFDILKNARAEGIKVPVIFLTAKSLIEDKIYGLDLGADDYLTKPFDAGELLARIRARLRAGTAENINGICAYDIRLDPATYKLVKDSKSVKLSKTEYALLEYFIINKGQILPRDLVINKIWGFDDDTDYNNLEVYVSFLRKKLRFVKADAAIITKKGIGYSLEGSND